MRPDDAPDRSHRVILLTALIVVVIDQVTKVVASAQVTLHSRVPIVDGFAAFTHVHNRGMAFGLFNGLDWPWLRWVLVAVALAAVLVIWSYARQERARVSVLFAFGAILGGAVGNLVDRLRLGYVEDFILLHWGRHEWPAFNVADAAVTMGGIALFIALSREGDEPAADDEVAATDPVVGTQPPAGDDA